MLEHILEQLTHQFLVPFDVCLLRVARNCEVGNAAVEVLIDKNVVGGQIQRSDASSLQILTSTGNIHENARCVQRADGFTLVVEPAQILPLDFFIGEETMGALVDGFQNGGDERVINGCLDSDISNE